MKRSVLIVGPDFYYFNQSVAKAFEQLGWSAQVLSFDNPVHPYSLRNKILYKLAVDKERMREEGRKIFTKELEKVYETLRPDMLFVINGDNLLPEALCRFSTHSKLVLWLFDSIVRLPSTLPILSFFDAVFCYEQEDIPLLASQYGINARFLPQAVDAEMYFPKSGVSKDLDIVFAGDIYRSKRRQQILHTVVEHFPNLKIHIWGIYKPWYKGLFQCLFRERRDVYKNRNISYKQLNDEYNRARIVINIHNEQQHNGANPKVYEICASGAYQICDSNPYIHSLFHKGEVGLYTNEEELLKQIEIALEQDNSENAMRACKEVCSHHTFVERMHEVLLAVYSN